METPRFQNSYYVVFRKNLQRLKLVSSRYQPKKEKCCRSTIQYLWLKCIAKFINTDQGDKTMSSISKQNNDITICNRLLCTLITHSVTDLNYIGCVAYNCFRVLKNALITCRRIFHSLAHNDKIISPNDWKLFILLSEWLPSNLHGILFDISEKNRLSLALSSNHKTIQL